MSRAPRPIRCHRRHQPLYVRVLRRELRHATSSAENLDAVCDSEHLRHIVTDEDDGDALITNVLDQIQHAPRFATHAQGCRGLVHEDDAVGPIAARAIATRTDAGRRTGTTPGCEASEAAHPGAELFVACAHRRTVDEAELAEQSGRTISRPRNKFSKGGRSAARARSMIDRRYALSLRVVRRIEGDALADWIAPRRAVGARKDLHERRLPAPLSR